MSGGLGQDGLDTALLRDAALAQRGRVVGGLVAAAPGGLVVELAIDDPDVRAALHGLDDAARDALLRSALRIGVLALRAASGQVDAAAVRDAGKTVVADVRELLTREAGGLVRDVTEALRTYFDPGTGVLPQRIERLVARDGELQRVLDSYVGGAGEAGAAPSILARTLAAHVGEGSPVFQLLSPTDQRGLRAQIADFVQGALAEQRDKILAQFSLDSKESALSRLVAELEAGRVALGADLEKSVGAVVREFSLDEEGSALSRLVKKVELANEQIGKSLTLDDERAPLARMNRELGTRIEELVKKNGDFYTEVREALADLKGRRSAEARSTLHGLVFEEALGVFLTDEAQRAGDVYEPTGNTTGVIKNSKVGDFVVELGPDSAAAGARIVWEAKESAQVSLSKAREEIDVARKNRGAQLGVFVFSRLTAPDGLATFARYGNDLVVVWDAEDPASAVVLRAAYSVARALAVRDHAAGAETAEALGVIDRATRAVEKQLGYLDDLVTTSQTIERGAIKIRDRALKMKDDLEREVKLLDGALADLKQAA